MQKINESVLKRLNISKKRLQIIFHRIPIFVLGLLVFNNSKATTETATQFLYFEEHSSKIRWHRIYDLTYPLALSLADADRSNKKSIGLTHLGYSTEDPDGRGVTLTFTAKTTTPVSKEKTDPIYAVGFEPETIDLSLAWDHDEEKRLRSRLQLPKKLAANTTLPFQIKWNDIKGKLIYDWLTEDNGLTFFVKGHIKIYLNMQRSEALNPECITNWWKTLGIDDSIMTEPFLLTAELIKERCFESIILNERSYSVSDNYQKNFIGKLTSMGKLVRLSLNDVISAGTPIITNLTSSELEIPAVISFKPGKFLNENPSYVKDLSGDSIGLDGIKNSN